MSNDLEQRLRAYGPTIDAAAAADLALRHADAIEGSAQRLDRPRRTATALAALAIVGVTAVGAVAIAHRAGGAHSHVTVGTSPSTSHATSSTSSPCSAPGGDAGSCPEEGPPLTSEQKAQFAQWRSEYNQAEVALISRPQPGTQPIDDVGVVETMEFRVGCRVTLSAEQAAARAAPDQRAAAVDAIMQPELVRLTERNWPPQSQMPQIFTARSNQLKNGDFAAVNSFLFGDCAHALAYHP